MPNLGKYIKEQRRRQGLSQKEFGRCCGLSDATIQRIEGGRTSIPNPNHLCKIAAALHITRFNILKIAGYITEEDPAPAQKIQRLAELSDDDLNELQLFIDFLIQRKKYTRGGTECLSE